MFVAVVLTVPLLAGCQAFALPFLLWGEEPTKTVPAEYPYLENKKICVLVWAEMDTLFEYPNVQWELAEHLRVAMEASIKGVTFVPARQVVDLQRKEPGWERTPPAKIGERLKADRVLVIELTQYATREPDNPHLYRGRISGYLKLYDVSKPDSAPLYRSEIATLYPPDGSAPYGSTDSSVRKAAMEAFAQEVAGKFYERKVKVTSR